MSSTATVNRVRHIYEYDGTDIALDNVRLSSDYFTYKSGSLHGATSAESEFTYDIILKRHNEKRTPRKMMQDYKLRKVCGNSLEHLNLECGSHDFSYRLPVSRTSVISEASIDKYNDLSNAIICKNNFIKSTDTRIPSRFRLCDSSRLKSIATIRAMDIDKRIKSMSIDNNSTITDTTLSSHRSISSQYVQSISIDALKPSNMGIGSHSLQDSTRDNKYDLIESFSRQASLKETRWQSISVSKTSENNHFTESDCEDYIRDKYAMQHSMPSAIHESIQNITNNHILPTKSKLNAEMKDNMDCYTFTSDMASGLFKLVYQKTASKIGKAEEGSIPHRVVVNKMPFTVGTDTSSDLLFIKSKHPQIHPRHCKFVFREVDTGNDLHRQSCIMCYKIEVMRVNSSAIIFVNESPVRSTMIVKNGDVVSFGQKKTAICFRAIFRTFEECILLNDQINSLMLYPTRTKGSTTNTAEKAVLDLSPSTFPINISPCYSRSQDLFSNVKVIVFEITTSYKDNTVQPLDPRVINGDISFMQSTDDGCTFTSAREFESCTSDEESDINDDSVCQKKKCQPSLFNPASCFDPVAILFLNAYNGTAGTVVQSDECERQTEDMKQNDIKVDLTSAFRKYEKNKSEVDPKRIARLKALNTSDIPVVVHTSRSTLTDTATPRGTRIAVSRMKYIGMIDATYKSTIEELLPEIDALNNTNDFNYDILLKRKGAPTTSEQRKNSWVFQLEFFDKDDPIYKRAISDSELETSRYNKDSSNSSELFLRLNKTRVIFIHRNLDNVN